MYWIVGITGCVLVVAYCYLLGLEKFLGKYRWVFVCFLLMPVSVVFEFYLVLRNWFIFKAKSAPYLHKKKVEKIQHAVRLWNEDGKKTKMCTGRPGWMTMSLRVGKKSEAWFSYIVCISKYDFPAF